MSVYVHKLEHTHIFICICTKKIIYCSDIYKHIMLYIHIYFLKNPHAAVINL